MAQAKQGDTVQLHYMGKLQDGTVFDTSRERYPLQFTIGNGQVIIGFEQVVIGMNVGESKTARIPIEQAYGPHRDDLVVTIDVAPAAEALLADYIPDGAVRTEVGGRVRTSVRVSHYHGLKRLIASLPGVATVVEPTAARQIVADWASAGASRYHG